MVEIDPITKLPLLKDQRHASCLDYTAYIPTGVYAIRDSYLSRCRNCVFHREPEDQAHICLARQKEYSRVKA